MAKMTIPSLVRLLFPAFRTGMGSNARLGKEYMLLGKVCNDGLGEMGMYLAKTPGMKERLPLAWGVSRCLQTAVTIIFGMKGVSHPCLVWKNKEAHAHMMIRIKWRIQF